MRTYNIIYLSGKNWNRLYEPYTNKETARREAKNLKITLGLVTQVVKTASIRYMPNIC